MNPSEKPSQFPEHSRRQFLKLGAASLIPAITAACERVEKIVSGAVSLIENSSQSESKEVKTISIEEQRHRISEANKETQAESYTGRKTPVEWNPQIIVTNLTEGLPAVEARKILFEFVRDFPYRLLPWTPRSGVELYDSESGDCRHKREALYRLYATCGFKVRKVAVVLDWADLPIPKDILRKLKKSGTKSLHSGMEVEIDGKFVYVDPTWDRDLSELGFPVTQNWDGVTPTKEITNGECIKVPHDQYTSQQDLAAQHGIKFIESETKEFNQAFNTYLEKSRKKRQQPESNK